MKTYFFISDVHLGSHAIQTKKRESRLLSFLDYVEQSAQGLFIVGDLFDFWFEYRYVIPKDHFPLLCKLKHMADLGIEIHYLVGNHDFWLSDFFTKTLGISVHTDTLNISLNGIQFHLTHGDGLAKNDRGYRLLKKILRNPVNIKLFRLIHPDFGFMLAGQSSHASRTLRDVPNHDADYEAYARERFKEGSQAVIIGHTHRPMKMIEDTNIYINTGDWIKHYSYAKLSGTQLSLEHWQAKQV